MAIGLDTLERVREFADELVPLREELIANLVMIAQIPAPTTEETQRVRFLLDRFVESSLQEVGADEVGNAVGMLYGTRGHRTIMLASHLDTIFPSRVDHNVVVHADSVVGPGVGDDALGAAVVSMVPTVLEQLGIQLQSNLHLVGTIHSLGRGNHEGIRFYLDHSSRPVDFGIVVEGIQLGRLNYFSIGTLRGDIMCDVRPEPSRSYGTESALVVLNHIINRILSISVPTRPQVIVPLKRSAVAATLASETSGPGRLPSTFSGAPGNPPRSAAPWPVSPWQERQLSAKRTAPRSTLVFS